MLAHRAPMMVFHRSRKSWLVYVAKKKKGPTALLSMPEYGFFSNAFCFPEGAEKGKPWKNFGKVKGDIFEVFSERTETNFHN